MAFAIALAIKARRSFSCFCLPTRWLRLSLLKFVQLLALNERNHPMSSFGGVRAADCCPRFPQRLLRGACQAAGRHDYFRRRRRLRRGGGGPYLGPPPWKQVSPRMRLPEIVNGISPPAS